MTDPMSDPETGATWTERSTPRTPPLAAEVAAEFGRLRTVTAVVVAGSWAAGTAGEASDVDLYVYGPEPPALSDRTAIAARFADRWDVDNRFWEPGDEWIDVKTGLAVDVMYRTPAWIEAQLDRVLVRHEASVGYSTCFWHNALRAVPLVDPSGWYGRLQEWADQPYPTPLKRAIVAKNHPILRRTISSYLHQLELAVQRGDAVSVQHRVAALLASYFDVLFAVNGLPHPGEKRLLQFAATRCPKRPNDLEAQVDDLLAVAAFPANAAALDRVSTLLDGLDDLLAREGLISAGIQAAAKRSIRRPT